MKLKIFEKLRPFSHSPGCSYVLPRTSLVFTIYPTLVKWHDLSDPGNSGELRVRVTGPVKGFTSQLDLERGLITVWGHATEGHYKFRIQPNNRSFVITKLKDVIIDGDYKESTSKESPLTQERLYLGVSKKQEWETLDRRCDLKELLPIWYSLSQQVPTEVCAESTSLYEQCKILIEQKDRVNIGTSVRSLYQSAFGQVFVPRLHDEDHQGFVLPAFSATTPLAILSAGRELIRSLFISFHNHSIDILPALPTEFHCGKLIKVRAKDYGEIDIEWTKKTVRRLIFRCEKDVELQFNFQNHLRSFRLRRLGDRAFKSIDCAEGLSFTSGQTYLLDNFRK